MSNISNISVYLMAGENYTFEVPNSVENNGGYFPDPGPIVINGKSIDLFNGFYLENNEAGSIDSSNVYSDRVAIDYKHKLPIDNTIWFVSLTGEKVRILVSNVPVHDHASIKTGGPAYGTYYNEVQAETVEG